jgi:hypothetical protein
VPNLEDRSKFRDILGNEAEIARVFQERDWSKIAKLAYVLLVEKSDFPATPVEEYDDDGALVKKLLTGPAALMRAVKNLEEGDNMVKAMVSAIRNGDPIVEEMMKTLDMADVQKKKAPGQPKNLTGLKSTTSLRPSTATRKKRSAS